MIDFLYEFDECKMFFVFFFFFNSFFNFKILFKKTRFFKKKKKKKNSLFRSFFILHRFYSKLILVYSRFCTSSMSNLVIYRSSLLKRRDIIMIRTYSHLNSLNQVHLNYTTFNIHLNHSKFIFIWIIRISSSFELLGVHLHLNYSIFIFIWTTRISDFIWIIRRSKFHFKFRHLDFHLNYSITAFNLMFKKSSVEYRILEISVH